MIKTVFWSFNLDNVRETLLSFFREGKGKKHISVKALLVSFYNKNDRWTIQASKDCWALLKNI